MATLSDNEASIISDINSSTNNLFHLKDGDSGDDNLVVIFGSNKFVTKLANNTSVTDISSTEDIWKSKETDIVYVRGTTEGKFYADQYSTETGKNSSGGNFTGWSGFQNAIPTNSGNVKFVGIGTEGSFAALKAAKALEPDVCICQQLVNKIPAQDSVDTGNEFYSTLPIAAEEISLSNLNSSTTWYWPTADQSFSTGASGTEPADWNDVRKASLFELSELPTVNHVVKHTSLPASFLSLINANFTDR